MFLVVDANVIFSALISRGKTFRIFSVNSIINFFDLVAPEFLKEELKEHKDEVIKKSKLSASDVEKLFQLIEKEIQFVSSSEFLDFLEHAKKISPADDFPYVALALKIKSLGVKVAIWSNDKELKKCLKDVVDIFSTNEVFSILFDKNNKFR